MVTTKRKAASAVAAVAVAAAVALGGTFAWQSISQTALNEASDTVNPGGRLHDDFTFDEATGVGNKDVYVENFAEEDIFARVRLEEFFQIGVGMADALQVAGTEDAETGERTYDVRYFDRANDADEYWDWGFGGSTVYMPTFNKNKDSLEADVNGTYDYVDPDTGESDPYGDYVDYLSFEGTGQDGEPVTGIGAGMTAEAAYDNDANDVEDENVEHISETHYVSETLGATLLSMEEWANDRNSEPGEYWVYDSDGWVYWAQAIAPGTATGLLLDSIELTGSVDDSWHYAINVVAQFVTADDLGAADGTGFYSDGAPTPEALALLEAIGVDVGGTVATAHYLALNWTEDAAVYGVEPGESIVLSIDEWEGDDGVVEGDLTSVTVSDSGTEESLIEGEGYTYDSATQTLVILDESVASVVVRDNSGNYAGYVYLEGNGGGILGEPALTFNGDSEIPFAIPAGSTVDLWVEDYENPGNLEFYLVNQENNSNLTASPHPSDPEGAFGTFYLTEPSEKDGLKVIPLEGSMGPLEFTEYFYGVKLDADEDGSIIYEASFSDPSAANSVECVLLVAMDGDEVVATARTKVYDGSNHVYVGSNSSSAGGAWMLVFAALDENGNAVGYCVANAAQNPLEVDSMHAASVDVPENVHECVINNQQEEACGGDHSSTSTLGPLELHANSAVLSEAERGSSHSLSVSSSGETQAVTRWAVAGNSSSGTAIDADGNLTIGYFETAEAITVLATLEGEYYANAFTVSVTGDSGLQDISNEWAVATVNGSDEGTPMIYVVNSGDANASDTLWPGSIIDDYYVVEKNGFVDNETTLDNAVYLKNISSLELVGPNLGALMLSGSWSLGEEGAVQFGIQDGCRISFRTAGYEVEGMTLYIITADGRYIPYKFNIVSDWGE